jgi:hypothetical protein
MIPQFAIDNLTTLRREWQESGPEDNTSLIEVQGSVGLLLYDVVEALRLSPQQQRAVLGIALYVEIKEYVYSTVQQSQQISQVDED